VKEIVDAVANGYNGTIVAYGQTGSNITQKYHLLRFIMKKFMIC